MIKEDVLSKFAAALHSFSSQELKYIMHALNNIKTRKALIKVIESILNMRETVPDNYPIKNEYKIHSSQEIRSRVTPLNKSQQRLNIEDDLKDMFFKYFFNRELYPTTKDVVNSINNFFNCQLDYDTFRKRGRRDAVSKCWAYLNKLPKQRRRKILRDFFDNKIGRTNISNEYRQLFKLLTNNE